MLRLAWNLDRGFIPMLFLMLFPWISRQLYFDQYLQFQSWHHCFFPLAAYGRHRSETFSFFSINFWDFEERHIEICSYLVSIVYLFVFAESKDAIGLEKWELCNSIIVSFFSLFKKGTLKFYIFYIVLRL